MSRFWLTTFLTAIAGIAGAVFLHHAARIWFLAALAVVYAAIFATGMTCIGLQFFCGAICGGDPSQSRVTLTFDDGPDPAVTPGLLDLLKREQISATFFCIGRNVEAHPELAKRIVADGHLIGNHFFTHAWWIPFLRSRDLVDEMQRTQEAIERATGFVPVFVRPPVGLTNPHFPAALACVGLRVVGWNLRTFDTSRSAKSVILKIRSRVRPGSIIVLHDGKVDPAELAEILADVIPFIRSRGLDFARLDKGLGME
jgi:peptidoglycan/xylan/chitin deacetylase (PgdA/CDA1 family)